MKKTLFALLVVLALFVSCKQQAGGSGFSYSKDEIFQKLPDAVSVTFDNIPNDGLTTSYHFAQGNNWFLFEEGSDGILFVTESGTTTRYEKVGTTYTNGGSVDGSVLNASKVSILGFVGFYSHFSSSSSLFTKTGTETIAGISCEMWSFVADGNEFTFSINTTTGMCMKYALTNSEGTETLLVTSYTTTGVTCPAHG